MLPAGRRRCARAPRSPGHASSCCTSKAACSALSSCRTSTRRSQTDSTRAAPGSLRPPAPARSSCSQTSRHHHRPSGAYGLAQEITVDEADQIVMPLTPHPSPARRHRPRPNGSRQLTDAKAGLYNTMQVRQARAYVVHRPALRASLPGAPKPSPGPHLLLVAELRAPLSADPARMPAGRARR
jgi:hypothetical protein